MRCEEVKASIRLLVSGAVLLSCASATYAGEALSLKDAVRLTLERSNYLRVAESDVRSMEQDVKVARSYGLPRVMLEESFVRTDIPSYVFSYKIDQERMTGVDMAKAPASFNEPNPLSDFKTSISIEQPLYAPRTGIRVDMARAEVEASRLRLQRNREDAVFNTVTTYIDVQKARATHAAVEAGMRDAEEHLRVARVREDSGVGVRADVLRAAVSLSEMQADKVRAENDLRIARSRLALAVGEEYGAEVDAADNGVSFSTPGDLQETVLKAVDARSDIRELMNRLENTRNLERLARADYLPSLSLSGSYHLDDRDIPFGSDGQHWMVGATLKWEAFDGFRRRAEEAKAHEARTMLRERLDAYRKEVAFRLKESWLRMDEAARRMDIASGALKEAEEGSRLVAKRFENSLSTMAEVLDAQAALDKARANLVQAEKERVLALARVWHNAGLLLTELDITGSEALPQ